MGSRIFLILIGSLLILSCSKKSEKILRLDQLNSKKICVLPGSAGEHAARKNFPNSNFMVLVGSADAALAVKTGKADAFVYDKSVLVKIVDKNKDLIILKQPVAKLEIAAAININNIALLNELNAAIQMLNDNGVLKSLRKKWVDTEYSQAPLLPQITNDGKNGIIKMGTCSIYEPFSFQANGIRTGIDIELSMLIGQLLGKKIEIVDMAFEGLIPALQSGKIDFALSNFNVTEERKKYVNFSLPYLDNDISVLVKR